MVESHTLAWLLTLEEPHTSVMRGSVSQMIMPESVREMAVGPTVGHFQRVSSKEVYMISSYGLYAKNIIAIV